MLRAQASVLLNLCLQSFKASNISNIFEEVILYGDSVVFRESEQYYINSSFEDAKKVLDRQIPFNPFTEDDWGIDQINGNLTVHRKTDDVVVLGKNLIRSHRSFFQNDVQCMEGAGDFIGSLIALTLNTQQEWFTLLGQLVMPSNYSSVLNTTAISKLFVDESSVEAYINGLLTTAGHTLTRTISQLDACIEKSAYKQCGWDIYSYSLRKGVITIYNMGDARILDFENRLITDEN